MNTHETQSNDYIDLFKLVRRSASTYAFLSHQLKSQVLHTLSGLLKSELDSIVLENTRDCVQLEYTDPKYDRLLLTPKRLSHIADSILEISHLPDPVGRILEDKILQNGLKLVKKTVPLGVIGMIFESRPNVTIDAFALSFMAGNGCVLKGGKEAHHTNQKLIELIHAALSAHNVAPYGVALLPSDRSVILDLCKAKGFIDVLIPRGGRELIEFVTNHSIVPVIETGAGVVHAYFDESGDLSVGRSVITNSKARRVSVCNALDCLLIHENRLSDLPKLLGPLIDLGCTFVCDLDAYKQLTSLISDRAKIQLMEEADKGREYLSLTICVQSVPSLEFAISYIETYSSKHSEVIISSNTDNQTLFLTRIDAACVYSNASTAFTDGGEFGMGSEIGISTQKLHVRGPFSAESLVSFKWIIYGNGEIRSDT